VKTEIKNFELKMKNEKSNTPVFLIFHLKFEI